MTARYIQRDERWKEIFEKLLGDSDSPQIKVNLKLC